MAAGTELVPGISWAGVCVLQVQGVFVGCLLSLAVGNYSCCFAEGSVIFFFLMYFFYLFILCGCVFRHKTSSTMPWSSTDTI